MFEQFPELYGVAPAFNSIPGRVEARKRRWGFVGGDEGEGKGKEVQRIGRGVQLGVDERGLKWHKITDKGKEVVYFTFW